MGALFFLVDTKPLMCPIILIVVLWLVAGLLPRLNQLKRSNTMKLVALNPIRAIRRILDARVEAKTLALLEVEDRLLAERIQQHRLLNRQRMCRVSMGAKHIGHPDYRFNGRHSNDDAIYTHFREGYLETIRDAAEMARGDNPMACMHAARLSHQL